MQEIAEYYDYNVTVTIDSQYGKDQLPMVATIEEDINVALLQDGQDVVLLKTKNVKVGILL